MSKYRLPVVMLGIVLCIVSCGKKIEQEKTQADAAKKRTAVVTASTNLVVRAKPERTATKLGVIAHGAIVEILQEGDGEITIDKITSKWYRVGFNGLDGWAFGGYLDLGPSAASASPLVEENDPKQYIGKAFAELDPALKKKTVSCVTLKNGAVFYAFEYDNMFIFLTAEKNQAPGTASGFRVSDTIKISHNVKAEKVFFPNGGCLRDDIRDPLVAVASMPGNKDGSYTAILRAWTIDPETNRFTPALPDGIRCKGECSGK